MKILLLFHFFKIFLFLFVKLNIYRLEYENYINLFHRMSLNDDVSIFLVMKNHTFSTNNNPFHHVGYKSFHLFCHYFVLWLRK